MANGKSCNQMTVGSRSRMAFGDFYNDVCLFGMIRSKRSSAASGSSMMMSLSNGQNLVMSVVVVLACVSLGYSSLQSSEFDSLLRAISSLDETPIEPISPICVKLVDDFKDASANYTKCIIENARSYQRCQLCIDKVIQVLTSFRLLAKKQNGSILCTESYPGMGEVLVFRHFHEFVKKNWANGGCQNCFAWYTINATISNELSNTTIMFQWLSLQFYKCLFNDSYTGNLVVRSRDFLHRLREIQSNETICKRCKKEYDKLNGFYVAKYETMYDKKDDVICADIAELMNFTRYVWQEVYHCHIERVSVWQIILTSVIFCCVPVVFYLVSKIFGQEVEPNVIPSKRFRGSLAARASTSSGNHNHLLT